MKIAITFILMIALVFACSNGVEKSDSKTKKASMTQQDDPHAEGKKAFKYCIACHGKDGQLAINGAVRFSESVLKLEERIEIITNGQGMMTPFKGILSEKEIKAVAEYTIHLGEENKE